MRPASTRPGEYRSMAYYMQASPQTTARSTRSRAPRRPLLATDLRRGVPLSRCVATDVLSPAARRRAPVCLSVCRACRPRLRKDERNRNPIPTSSESGEEQPSFLKQSLDAGCTTRVCLPSPLPHPSTPPLSLCRLSQRPRSRPMTILDVKEVACRPMVVDGLSVITSRYENRGLNRPCAGTGSALVVTHNAAAWALDSRLTPHSLALHPLRSVRARLHFARRCRVNL